MLDDTVNLIMGCSGWSYKSWVGNFYPTKMRPDKFLSYYSKIFDAVEIDSSFYSLPDASRVRSWNLDTGQGFKFCPKVPGNITHQNKIQDPDSIFPAFLQNIKILGNKLGPILLQLPPHFTYSEGVKNFIDFLELVPEKINFAVEFRDNSWLNETVYRIMRDHNFITVWSEAPFVKIVPPLTSNDIYLRLIGERDIPESQFGKIRRTMDEELHKWAAEIKKVQDDVDRIFIFANNHFQGFAPGSVNEFRRVLGLHEIPFVPEKTSDYHRQGTLF